MTLWSLTKEKKDELLRQKDDKLAELKRLQARTPISLWKEDLDNLLNELNRVSFIYNNVIFNFFRVYNIFFIIVRRKRTKGRTKIKTVY